MTSIKKTKRSLRKQPVPGGLYKIKRAFQTREKTVRKNLLDYRSTIFVPKDAVVLCLRPWPDQLSLKSIGGFSLTWEALYENKIIFMRYEQLQPDNKVSVTS